MNERTLEATWNMYREKCIHPESPQYQINDLKMAFFGGAIALFTIVNSNLSATQETTLADLHLMQELEDEMMQFRKDVVAGKYKVTYGQ